MEHLTTYLSLETTRAPHLGASHCRVSAGDAVREIEYYLAARDCLFDVADTNYRIRFRVEPAYFARFGEALHLPAGQLPICCNAQLKLYELIRCAETGLARKLQLEAIFLDLLQRLLVTPALPVGCSGCANLTAPLELEKLERARAYVLEHLDEKITTPIVAGAVGTNQCYLKRGFKEVYGQTLFEFTQEHRLTRARHLIETTDLPLAEVANRVGYASASSFSQSFKNYFGVNPSVFSVTV